jgi:hypothetical protein
MDMKKNKNQNQYQSIIDSMRLLEDLLIPQVTPRVPGYIRDRAREIINQFPDTNSVNKVIDNLKTQENAK